jgi:hypothetical protein
MATEQPTVGRNEVGAPLSYLRHGLSLLVTPG